MRGSGDKHQKHSQDKGWTVESGGATSCVAWTFQGPVRGPVQGTQSAAGSRAWHRRGRRDVEGRRGAEDPAMPSVCLAVLSVCLLSKHV